MSVLDVALDLANRGARVFPCIPRDKKPLTEHGYHDASDDENTIRSWFQQWPEANLGIACDASGIVVIDIDPRHGGDATFARLERELRTLPRTPTVTTGGGGQHYYLRAPDGVEFRGALGDGVDLKFHGYVMAAESIHPSGKPYTYLVSPDDCEPAAIPHEWIAKMLKPAAPAPSERSEVQRPAGDCSAYARAAIESELEKIRTAVERTRNNTANKGAHSLAQLFATCTIPDVREELIAAAMAAGLPEGEARKTVESGWRAGNKKPRAPKPRNNTRIAKSSPPAAEELPMPNEPPEVVDAEQVAGKPLITVSTDEPVVIDLAIAALARAPEVYVRGAEIVEIVTDDLTTRGVVRAGPLARIHRSPEARVRELLAREASWVSYGGGDDLESVHPPKWAVQGVMARGHWPRMRILVGISEAPTMRPDGSILSKPGYDAATGIYLAPGVTVSIPDRPTRDRAVAAAAELAEVIADFPIATEAGRSAWIAGVTTSAARPAIDGPTPMVIVDASAPGSGKTLLADVAAVIATGRPAARTTFVSDDSEMRKRITALALAGDPLVLLDNVVGTLGCPSLDAALTGTTWRDRVLGVSTMTEELPLRIAWWATGNGLVIGADLVRRSLLVRLEPMTERPEERTGWRHPRLLDYVRDHRSALLGAALTIPRAYLVAGRPDQGLTPMGSYTAWSDLVRSAVVWAGLPDPCATVAEIRACDPKMDALRAVLQHWPAAPNTSIVVAELLARAATAAQWRSALLEWCPAHGGDGLTTARALGFKLRGVRRRVVDGRYLDAAPKTRDGVAWMLRGVCDDGDNRDYVSPTRETDESLNIVVAETKSPSSPSSQPTLDPLAQLAHCLRAKVGTVATEQDKTELLTYFSTLNGTSEAASQRLWSYWLKAPAPTVADFIAREPKQARAQ